MQTSIRLITGKSCTKRSPFWTPTRKTKEGREN